MNTTVPSNQPSSAPGAHIHDLSDINHLSEDAIVTTIRTRFLQNKIYTRISNSTLVTVNPYRNTPIESESGQYLAEYKQTDIQNHKRHTWLEPHIFQHVNQIYFHMRRTGYDQSIILRGPSGGGKTETRQIALYHLLALSSGSTKSSKVQQLVQKAQRVLEAFGHAKTLSNTNASRFGSCVEYQFNNRGRMVGAKYLDYLLEKSRITDTSPDESNFHVFYYLVHDKALLLNDGAAFRYLHRAKDARPSLAAVEEPYLELKTNLKAFGINKDAWKDLTRILAAILHLGNLQFIDDTKQQDSAVIKNTQCLEIAADLLGVEPDALQNILTYKTKLIKHDMTTLFLDARQSAQQRDHLAQTLYSLLFSSIVETINKKLCKSDFYNFISFLDFPGTEKVVGSASFYQLCANFSNEKLQHMMMTHIFQRHVQVYNEPSINRDPPVYKDTFSASLEAMTMLISSSSQAAIEEIAVKQQPAITVDRTGTFTIKHFSGPVMYSSADFIQECTETLCADFVALFRNDETSNKLLRQLFEAKSVATECQASGNRIVTAQQPFKPRRSPSMKRNGKASEAPESNPAPLASPHRLGQLNSALTDMFTSLNETQMWWVLCLRPNDLFLPNSCDAKKLATQIQTFQVLDLAIRARHEYTLQMTLTECCERYQDIINETTADRDECPRNRCLSLQASYSWNERMMVVGEEQVYLNGNAWFLLENRLRSMEKKEQRRARCLAKGIPFDEDEDSQSMYACDMDAPPSTHSGEHCFQSTPCYTETASICTSSHHCDESIADHMQSEVASTMTVEKERKRPKDKKRWKKLRKARGFWVMLTWICTWCFPSILLRYVGGMRRSDIRLAWREKVTLCFFIFILCAAMIWFICFFGQLLCPHQDIFTQSELQAKSGKDNAYIAIRGEVFDLTSFAPRHWASEVIPTNALFQYAGQDVSDLFPVQVSALCDGIYAPIPKEVVLDARVNITDSNAIYHDFRYFRDDYRPDWYFEQMVYLRKNYRLGFMGYDREDILNQASFPVQVGGISTQRRWAILHNNVYDLTSYMMGGARIQSPDGTTSENNLDADFMEHSITELFRQLAGTDISAHFDALPLDKDARNRQLTCLRNLFFVGKVDTRNSPRCLFSEYLLLLITVFLCSVILFKFLAALCLTKTTQPMEEFDKFIVCQVPCYTEGEESLRKTIDSVATLKYDDKRKLLFLVADGMIIGSGNDRPTPRIVLDILGVDPNIDPEPQSFLSLGQGKRQHNMAKVYSGLYECSGHVVPYIVVVKVGTPDERQKSGNRGKRDSQMIVMNFFNKVHYDAPMTPLELTVYHELRDVIGVHPNFYEFVLMIDADTEVLPESLNRMVSHFVHDPKIVGLCGETMLSNEKDTWVTMIQVYEYYISHYLSKAFESLFGSVTCLPGCFCMYRIRSTTNTPLLVSHSVIQDYAENNVDTLHKKNLLHLGEDRYLTTLILKHFPNYKTKFTPDAACMTNAPDQWPVLLSQRRRWINSTIHNLGELMFLPQLCGFCCFSMRFVVMLDLLSTLVMPAVVCYLGYLIYQLCTSTSQVPLISIITLAGVYGLQAIIFILRRKWEHIGWMIVYILAIPVFSFLVPIYAFWHFDDFSWGNTRIVVGEKGQKKVVGPEDDTFDPSTIPRKRWAEHEQEMQHLWWENESAVSESTTCSPCPRSPSQANGQRTPNYPTEDEIMWEINRILNQQDWRHLTKKQVREKLSATFGVDFNSRRDIINKYIDHSISQRL